jgi:uroporphyrinogen-III synthase
MNDNLNIKGKVIAITRPAERSQKAVDIVEKYGGIPLVAPTLELQVSNSKSLINLCKIADKLDWMIFTSPTGILSLIKHCKDLKGRLNPNCKIAVIGPRTGKYLNEQGLDADIIPEDYTAEGLLEIFKDIDVRNKKIGIPRTMAARDVLPEGLKAMGAEVLLAEAYKSVVPKDKGNVKKLITSVINKDVDAVTFTSTLTVKNLFEVAEEEGKKEELIKSLQNNVLVAAIGPVTAKPLEKEDIIAITPDEYTVKAMLEKLFGEMNSKI